MIELVESVEQKQMPLVHIKVMGIGGAGGNTINSMVSAGLDQVEFIAANTDAQALEGTRAHTVVQLGTALTKGLGSGANPDVGRKATEEDLPRVLQTLEGADMVFLVAGLGGGTGSGGIPVVAQELHEKNILTTAVVTKPFAFEGKRRLRIAEETIAQLKGLVDTLIVIPNQKLIVNTDKKISLVDAFEMVNAFTTQFIRSVATIITRPGHINVDFADIQTIMRSMGSAVMGTGTANGENRAEEATLSAISSPLLEEQGISGAKGVLLNVTGSSSLGLHEVGAAAQLIYEQADSEANIVLGSVIDESMGESVSVTIIATGFDNATRNTQQLRAATSANQSLANDTSLVIEQPLPEPESLQPRILVPENSELPITTPSDPLEIPAIMRSPNTDQRINDTSQGN